MSDETVRVPRALVEALREALGHRKAADFSARFHRESLFTAARALVDAAERPDEGTEDEAEDAAWLKYEIEADEIFWAEEVFKAGFRAARLAGEDDR